MNVATCAGTHVPHAFGKASQVLKSFSRKRTTMNNRGNNLVSGYAFLFCEHQAIFRIKRLSASRCLHQLELHEEIFLFVLLPKHLFQLRKATETCLSLSCLVGNLSHLQVSPEHRR